MRRFYVIAFLISLSLAVMVSPYACGWNDGLERVAADYGFEDKAVDDPYVDSPLPDYKFPTETSPSVATAAAGALGTLVSFCLLFAAGFVLTRGRKK